MSKKMQKSQEQIARYNNLLDEFKQVSHAPRNRKAPRVRLLPVASLGELARWARQDDRYNRLAMITAENLGWSVPRTEAPDLLDKALRWLRLNAEETTEAGVVAEVNACRDLV